MSTTRTNINNFQDAITETMQSYAQTTGEEIKGIVDDVAKETVKEIKKNAPVRSTNRSRRYNSSGKSYAPGTYKKSWTSLKEYENSYRKERVVYSKGQAQITHLLENGHACKFGGRTYSDVRPRVHIRPAEEFAIREIEKRVKGSVKNG